MKLVFLGTPDFAVPALEGLVADGHTVSLAVTQPDKPKGRGQKPAAPPVKQKARQLGIPVLQPATLKSGEFHAAIAAQAADLLVVVAFRILPADLFALTRLGAVNIHASLLPKYRGAAPIAWAIAQGETETGVTVFQLDQDVDHGKILAQSTTPIGPEETAGDVSERLSALGRDLLRRTLAEWEQGQLAPQEQNHELATPAPKLRKEDGRLDWSRPAAWLHNRIRAFNPYPICYTRESVSGRILRIHRAQAVPDGDGAPGRLTVAGGHPVVAAADGRLRLLEVQWEGKPRISGRDFVNGLRGAEGVSFA